jgi:hypothetical protein
VTRTQDKIKTRSLGNRSLENVEKLKYLKNKNMAKSELLS